MGHILHPLPEQLSAEGRGCREKIWSCLFLYKDFWVKRVITWERSNYSNFGVGDWSPKKGFLEIITFSAELLSFSPRLLFTAVLVSPVCWQIALTRAVEKRELISSTQKCFIDAQSPLDRRKNPQQFGVILICTNASPGVPAWGRSAKKKGRDEKSAGAIRDSFICPLVAFMRALIKLEERE